MGLLDGPDKLRLTGVHGGETDALESLHVERGRGLGGKVLAEGGPSFVSDYTAADSITHDYDAPIAREGLAGVLCLPLVVSDDLIGVAYVSDRTPTTYSDVQLDRVLTAVESARLALSMADPLHAMAGLLSRGIIALPCGDGGDFAMALVPPLTITHEQIRAVAEALRSCQLEREGSIGQSQGRSNTSL